MTTSNLLGWCASRVGLPRARADLSEFLALRRRRTPARKETLLGLWVDPRWGEHLPCELLWRELDGKSGAAHIRETAGIAGIWMLCWLELPASARPLTRHALLASLAAGFGPAAADPPPAFVPVFPLDAPASKIRTELQRLTTEYSDLLVAPLYQDARSGRLQTLTKAGTVGAANSGSRV